MIQATRGTHDSSEVVKETLEVFSGVIGGNGSGISEEEGKTPLIAT